jgi:hypothetical protein
MTRVPLAVRAVVVLALAGCGADPAERPAPTPEQPTSTPGSPAATELERAAPVWWDADGLHRGDLVEEAAVPLPDGPDRRAIGGVGIRRLALVRSGAVYRDERTGQVWFHPWGGTPRVVGRSTAAGPGGDPESDVAAWFDGADLVVYDTAHDEVISRSPEVVTVSPTTEYVEHVGHGNGWVHVSPAQVVWRYAGEGGHELARRDLAAGTSEAPWQPRPASGGRAGTDLSFVDLSSRTAVWAGGREHDGLGTFVFDSADSERTSTIDPKLEYPGRLSPDGSWLLTAELADGTHGVAMTDLRSNETWKPFDEDTYAFFSWAYGDVAVMLTNRSVPDGAWTLTSCTASTRSCVELDTRGDVVLPNP